jgi:hypothetical protein
MTDKVKAKSAKGRLKSSSRSRVATSIPPELVVKAFGGTPIGVMSGTAPEALLQVRGQLAKRLRSSGGRPSLEGAEKRTKVPLSDQQIQAIEGIASALSQEDGPHPSFGQVASVLIDLALAQLGRADVKRFTAYFHEHAKPHAE